MNDLLKNIKTVPLSVASHSTNTDPRQRYSITLTVAGKCYTGPWWYGTEADIEQEINSIRELIKDAEIEVKR